MAAYIICFLLVYFLKELGCLVESVMSTEAIIMYVIFLVIVSFKLMP